MSGTFSWMLLIFVFRNTGVVAGSQAAGFAPAFCDGKDCFFTVVVRWPCYFFVYSGVSGDSSAISTLDVTVHDYLGSNERLGDNITTE